MPGGEFHAGESGLLPQRHRPHLSADAAGSGVPQAGLFQPGFCGQAQRFRLQGGAAGHALQGSGGIRLLHRVGRPLCALLLSGHPGLHPSDRSPQLVLPGAPPAGGIHPGGLPQQHRSAWGRLSGESLRHRWGGQPGDHRRGPPLQRGSGDGALPHQSPAERPQPSRVKESPQGYCHEPHHPGYRRRSGVDAAGHPPASDSAKDGVQPLRYRHPPGPHGPGRLLRSEEGPGPLEARLRRHRREAGASGRPLSPHRRGHGSTGRQAGGRPGHAGQPHQRQQLRHGPQHGA